MTDESQCEYVCRQWVVGRGSEMLGTGYSLHFPGTGRSLEADRAEVGTWVQEQSEFARRNGMADRYRDVVLALDGDPYEVSVEGPLRTGKLLSFLPRHAVVWPERLWDFFKTWEQWTRIRERADAVWDPLSGTGYRSLTTSSVESYSSWGSFLRAVHKPALELVQIPEESLTVDGEAPGHSSHFFCRRSLDELVQEALADDVMSA